MPSLSLSIFNYHRIDIRSSGYDPLKVKRCLFSPGCTHRDLKPQKREHEVGEGISQGLVPHQPLDRGLSFSRGGGVHTGQSSFLNPRAYTPRDGPEQYNQPNIPDYPFDSAGLSDFLTTRSPPPSPMTREREVDTWDLEDSTSITFSDTLNMVSYE